MTQELLDQLAAFGFEDPLSYWRKTPLKSKKESAEHFFQEKAAGIPSQKTNDSSRNIERYKPGHIFNFTSEAAYVTYKQTVLAMEPIRRYYQTVSPEFCDRSRTNLSNYHKWMERELNKISYAEDNEDFNERVIEKVTQGIESRLSDSFSACHRAQRSNYNEQVFYQGLLKALDTYLSTIGLEKVANRQKGDRFQEEDYDLWRTTEKKIKKQWQANTFDEIEMCPYAMYFLDADDEKEVRYVKGKGVIYVYDYSDWS